MTTLSDKPKMDDRTRKALEESIAKWERNAVAETPAEYLIGESDCPLCQLFYRSCEDCPVMQRTGMSACSSTPYIAAAHAKIAWRDGTKRAEAAHAAAREEVAFLKSLLPQDDEK